MTKIYSLKHLSVGDDVCVDDSSSSISGTTFRIFRGKVEKVTPSGQVTVKLDGIDVRKTFMPSNKEKAGHYGATIITEEEFARLKEREQAQKVERTAEKALRDLSMMSLRRNTKAEYLAALRAAVTAVEALPK